ncbi:hypothetical protein PVAND_006684 [Polypedilum vanderplanki]|uniref:Protein artemis n=1 Tax=Polypedilum vanderplanki TaxID=319348 RepID=A0A9J6C4V1_POLVA|nr:hypothetical protein PVAND_006684 [Polypedilum vanderplanki]
MSTFSGEIIEIPGIAVDNFTNDSVKCFFLSHCHTDHLIGIKDLSNSELPIYTTELSAMILKTQYPDLNVKSIEIGVPTNFELEIDSKHETKFIVTLINGGHCIGSCMFLFQTEEHDILYTGDFRFTLKDVENIQILKDAKIYGKLKIYLDTTFMKNEYKNFPRQKDSCQKVVEIVQNHLGQSQMNKVMLQTSARYGYERLLIQLYEKLNEKIFVANKKVMEQYLMISEISKCITTSKSYSRLHLNTGSEENHDVEKHRENYLKIHLSAMFWTNWNESLPFIYKVEKNNFRVCYATHCSLSEIKDILYYLKPLSIYPTVLPEKSNERTKMFTLIDEIINSYNDKKTETKERFSFKRLKTS